MHALVDDLWVVCMSRKHMGVQLIGVAKFLRHLWALPNDSKHSGVFINFNGFVMLTSCIDV